MEPQWIDLNSMPQGDQTYLNLHGTIRRAQLAIREEGEEPTYLPGFDGQFFQFRPINADEKYIPGYGRPLHFLRYLVLSVPDSLLFEHLNGQIRYIAASIKDTPWHNGVGELIATQFSQQLQSILPEGRWRLGITWLDATEEEGAAL